MKIGIYPGSFDPITFGHIDIIERASKLVDVLYVSILKNPDKKSLFTIEEKKEMIVDAIKDIKNVKVESFGGLLVDYAKEKDASIIIRGLRAVTDFEYELQLAQTNRQLNKDVDTIFLLTNLQYSYISSSLVKQVASYGGDISKFATKFVAEKLKNKFTNK
ncbi:MAG: pantetheine-phosphate adenylyltransferase [Lachnospiraceae bacterium]|nr:pantetheine-phosphate adenylyltransferase [Lachnospiraceae bacterium]